MLVPGKRASRPLASRARNEAHGDRSPLVGQGLTSRLDQHLAVRVDLSGMIDTFLEHFREECPGRIDREGG